MKNLFIILFLLVLSSCNADSARPEVVDKLRAIGVKATPYVVSGSTPVTLEVYSLVPLEQTVKQDVYEDDSSVLPILPISSVSGDYTDLSSLRIYKATYSGVTLPLEDDLLASNTMSLRYGMSLSASSGEEEKVVGNLVLHPSTSDLLANNATPPEVTITGVEDGVSVPSSFDLNAEISNRNDESFKIGWYTTSGEIKNRRALSTSIEKMEAGAQTIVVTIRSKSTNAFAYKAIDVTVE